MRRVLFLLFALFALSAAAQTPALPPGLQPIPEPPPIPAGASDEELEPQVTIIQRGEDKVEEYRLSGKLYMIKVTPPHGVPYYLVDEHGDGVMTRKDTLTSGTRPPMWVIKRF
ncbi:conserved exported protein of unknown function [Georgfuchsia toluolica]|uniref:DUF2782 domain-containing protein n=1 Tax=Georgfuchsia toluolica TaxID=424218 RepID=A0A916N974_9PROT|nr:DUF2782 domain-containing protein [Georgfuchsia toluolica]CAG4884172.1 conserved exported protein of unknown function [Georgfuchsia toluolica]